MQRLLDLDDSVVGDMAPEERAALRREWYPKMARNGDEQERAHCAQLAEAGGVRPLGDLRRVDKHRAGWQPPVSDECDDGSLLWQLPHRQSGVQCTKNTQGVAYGVWRALELTDGHGLVAGVTRAEGATKECSQGSDGRNRFRHGPHSRIWTRGECVIYL
eukprot:COSAG01_NODE_1165_length_11446_cov_16.276196_3_plen_160_part_00